MKTPCLRCALLVLMWASGCLGAATALADEVATLQKVTGVVSVNRASGTSSLGYEGFSINAGDTVNTEQDSSVLLVFKDKGQVALRPGTRFQVKEYHYEDNQPKADNLIFSLLKGGLRTITGFISKRGNRDAYRLQSATSTIGIRGTDFTARLCDKDCAKEQGERHPVQPSPAGVIGRVAELTGSLTDVLPGNHPVQIGKSAPFFEGDELHMGDAGYALLVLTDGTRILLQRNGVMKMSRYHYEQIKPESSNILFELAKGTARIVTGLLGKRHPERVQFATATATIGIRGTAFDIVCGRKEQDPCDGELFISMREGKTAVTSGEHELDVNAGSTAYVASPGAGPELLAEVPASVKDNPNPLPESFTVDTNTLFGTGPQDVPQGLYASVNEGRIVLSQSGKDIEIGKGESGFAPANGGAPTLLSMQPAFLDNDPVLASFPFIPGLCGAN